MRTGFSTGIFVASLLAAPVLHAADGGASPSAAPTLQDYRGGDAPTAPSLPSSAPSLVLPPSGGPAAPATPSITKPEDDNWLLKGVEAQRKANEEKAAGRTPDSPLKPIDPLAPAKPLPLANPSIQTSPFNDPTKPLKGTDGISPLVPTAPKPVNPNQLKPLIQGLSTDATKPLATTGGTSTNAPSALSGFKSVESVNPDLTRPLYLDNARTDNSPSTYGMSSVGDSSATIKLPPGYEIPNAPGTRPLGATPIASAAPLAPISPQARPSGSSALSSFAPIQPVSIPAAPTAPQPPTARDLAPKAGPGAAMKVKDPLGADMHFIR